MINWRIKDFANPPAILQDALRLAVQSDAETRFDGKLFKSSHYRPREVIFLLKAYSLGKLTFDPNTEFAKCFYCESTSEVVASLQVEHYRPKAATHDNNRRSIPGTFGYYWLGVEWTNLILSCPKCNGSGAKGNVFTTKNRNEFIGTSLNVAKTGFDRAKSRADLSPLKDEQPDLLHPEIDNSYKYLKFNSLGDISHKLSRGKRTIEICKLDRRPLTIARYQVIKQFQDSFLEIVEYERNGMINQSQLVSFFIPKCAQLRNNYKREKPYTLLSRYMIEEFEDFFVSIIPNPYKSYLRTAFSKTS